MSFESDLATVLPGARAPRAGPCPHQYSASDADFYMTLETSGITYREAEKLLGALDGKTILDFGCGPGRSAAFLKSLGATKIIAVDHNKNMLENAARNPVTGTEYIHVSQNEIPLPDGSVDSAVSFNVFIEIPTFDQLSAVCKEIHRDLKSQSVFVVKSINPAAAGHTFKSFSYSPSRTRSRVTTCTITTDNTCCTICAVAGN